MLSSVYMLNLVDRGLMILLLQPIKVDLKLSDTQLGFLTGIAFGLFYAVLGIPIARWADRGNRVTITSIAIAAWGITVMGCLYVTDFTQLLIARVFAAIGESGCKPPTYSLVGDYFPKPAERTRALGIYMATGLLASLVSFLAGGWLNERYGWRTAFFIMGAPGLFLAVLVRSTIVEPRTQTADYWASERPVPSIKEVLVALFQRDSLRNLCLALVILYTMGLGMAPWYAAFMTRLHGMNTVELGNWFGAIFGIGGVAGALLGSYVSSLWFSDNERAQLRLSAVTVFFLLPFFIAFLTAPTKYGALASLVPLILAFNIFLGPAYALMQRLVPDQMRATTLAVIMLFINLIGMGLGPQLVGIMSDALAPTHGKYALRDAMLTMSLLAIWSSYHFWRASQNVKEDLAAMQQISMHTGIVGNGSAVGNS